MVRRIHSTNGNNRDVKDIKKKWDNLKVSAKSHVDNSRREARNTGEGQNAVGEIADDLLIIAAYKNLSTSASKGVTRMRHMRQCLS